MKLCGWFACSGIGYGIVVEVLVLYGPVGHASQTQFLFFLKLIFDLEYSFLSLIYRGRFGVFCG
jgi:hypothetical protein